jgi:hypothetical protein
MKIEIARAIALLTAEYDLQPFTDDRIAMWMKALACFPRGAVSRSTESHIKSSRFKPQLADIVAGCAAQSDANWLGADEAWALMPHSESDSCLMTDEIAQAMATAAPLIDSGDRIAARMAFKDAYMRLTSQAKIEGRQPRYFASFGTDAAGRVSMLANAVNAGRLSLDCATAALPEYAPDLVRMLGVKNHPLLAGPSKEGKERLGALLLTLRVGT